MVLLGCKSESKKVGEGGAGDNDLHIVEVIPVEGAVVNDKTSHTCLAIMMRYSSTVYVRFLNTGHSTDHLSHFVSGYILSLPSERIANTIYEVIVARIVSTK